MKGHKYCYLDNCGNSEANSFATKRKLEFDVDVEFSKKRKTNPFSLDEFFKRFPTLEEEICNQLDIPSLRAFTQISKEMVDCRLKSRFYWVRMVQFQLGSMYVEGIPKIWSKVIQRSPVKIVREFAQTINQFYRLSSKNKFIFMGQIPIGYIPIKCSPMHIVAERGNLELCQHVISRLEDKNPKDFRGETPLHWAAKEGHYGVSKLILENNINKNPKDDKGITPAHLAAAGDNFELCKLIIDNLENDGDKNPKDFRGGTLLHYAAAATTKGDLILCQFLIKCLESTGDKNPKDFEGTTPLHLAAEDGDMELCELLVENVTDKSPLNNKQETPKDLAYKNGNLYLSEVLS